LGVTLQHWEDIQFTKWNQQDFGWCTSQTFI